MIDTPALYSSLQNFDKFSANYAQRNQALSLVEQLNQLVEAVQNHRGISMGMLAGNKVYEKEFYSLQKELERRLATLEAFASLTGDILSQRDKENLNYAWNTVRHDWQEDDVGDNFELHSHFIDQLQGMILALSRKMEAPLVEGFSEDDVAAEGLFSKNHRQVELLNYICKQLPTMIEFIAKVRGLASYGAALGSVDYQNDRKLRFWVQCAREQHEKLRHRAQRLEGLVGGVFRPYSQIQDLELKFTFFLKTVEEDVLSGQEIGVSASQLFDQGSIFIDQYWAMVSDGIQEIRRGQDQDLQEWVRLGQ